MIPPFDDNGYLPPGVHTATLDEIKDRFGSESELRRVQMESLEWLIELARRAGVARVVINGSFTTDAFEPNDVDCGLWIVDCGLWIVDCGLWIVDCGLLIEDGFPKDTDAEAELVTGLPFLGINLAAQDDFDLFVEGFFATDRRSVNKGMVEVEL